MKLPLLTTLAVALSRSECNAFSASRNARNSAVVLKAANNVDNTDEAGIMSRRTAAATMFFSASASLIAAPMAAQADTSLDFSLPSYDTKMGGFGEGNEAYVKKGAIAKDGVTSDKLMTDPGADEKEKQLASMRKAEEARKEALAKKKAEQKERDDEAKRRAKEKKARDAERLKNIWSS